MPQPPFEADALSVEPGFSGTRLIQCDQSTGALLLSDPVVTTPISLSGIAGFQLGGVYLVGLSGAGATYSTVQDAVDAIPATSSPTAPNLVLIAPGTYTERVTIEKDGVVLATFGGGRVVIEAPDALGPTIEIVEAVTTIPTLCRLVGLTVVNGYNGQACVKLTGGAGSEVAKEEVALLNCELEATVAGSYQLYADTVNNIRVQGGTWPGPKTGTSARINQCASLVVRSVDQLGPLQLDYDGGVPGPDIFGSSYRVSNSVIDGDVQSLLDGQGSLTLEGCLSVGDVTVTGDRNLTVQGSNLGNLTLNGTTAAVLRASSRQVVAGTGTLAEDVQRGSEAFAASSTEAVVFGVAHPDADYTVCLEYEVNALAVTKNKLATGFTIEFPSGPQTTSVNYAVLR
jgi:hypothetical protein